MPSLLHAEVPNPPLLACPFQHVPTAVQVALWYGSVYIFFVWIYYAASGTFLIDQLNWHHTYSVGVYLVLPVAYTGLFYGW